MFDPSNPKKLTQVIVIGRIKVCFSLSAFFFVKPTGESEVEN
jgi:hypothetical protein